MSAFRIAVTCASLILPVGTAGAQDPLAGSEVAQAQCANCHQIGRDPQGTAATAPSFAAIAATKGMTQLSIQVFLRTSHRGMPNYVLSEREIADVASYVMSLGERHQDRGLSRSGESR